MPTSAELLRQSASQPSPPPAPSPGVGNGSAAPVDATPGDLREPLRDPPRRRPREPHEKYQIHPNEVPNGMDAMFVATKIRGAPNPRLGEFIRAGWRPARAADWPEFSDYGLYDQALVDMGVVTEVKPDSPVVRDDMMLVLRPKHQTERAKAEAKDRADKQINEHLRRVYDRSARDIGRERTIMRRNYGPNDMVDDQDIDAR